MSLALAKLALRTRALAVVVCTTGATTLEATATGYARASGSFITDGFMPGMEVTPTGFTQTAPGIITAVDALTLHIRGGRTIQTAAGARSLAVNVPGVRVFQAMEPRENGVVLPERPHGRPYWQEAFAPSTQRLTTNVPHGITERTGLYLITWAGLPNFDDIGLQRCIDAVLAAFPPAYTWTLSDGAKLEVRGDVAPWSREITTLGASWAGSLITIPWLIKARLP